MIELMVSADEYLLLWLAGIAAVIFGVIAGITAWFRSRGDQ